MNFELLFDNGGGITLITPDYCRAYDNPQHAAYDTAALLDGADPQEWDGNQPEFRRERHSEDDVMTADVAQAIREGGPWTRRGHAWNEFCRVLVLTNETSYFLWRILDGEGWDEVSQ